MPVKPLKRDGPIGSLEAVLNAFERNCIAFSSSSRSARDRYAQRRASPEAPAANVGSVRFADEGSGSAATISLIAASAFAFTARGRIGVHASARRLGLVAEVN